MTPALPFVTPFPPADYSLGNNGSQLDGDVR